MQVAVHFEYWRWCILFSMFVPIWWVASWIMHILVLLVEAQLVSFQQVVYYLIGVRVSFANCLPLLMLLESPMHNTNPSAVDLLPGQCQAKLLAPHRGSMVQQCTHERLRNNILSHGCQGRSYCHLKP